MKKLKLTQGKVVLLDNEDFQRLKDYRWHIYKNYQNEVVVRYDKELGKLFLHREVLNITEHNKKVYFRDGSGLNCQKSNLTLFRGNGAGNRKKKHRDNKSGFLGVHYNKANRKWRAQIKVYGKIKDLGSYIRKEDAVRQYDISALFYFGKDAKTNYPIKSYQF